MSPSATSTHALSLQNSIRFILNFCSCIYALLPLLNCGIYQSHHSLETRCRGCFLVAAPLICLIGSVRIGGVLLGSTHVCHVPPAYDLPRDGLNNELRLCGGGAGLGGRVHGVDLRCEEDIPRSPPWCSRVSGSGGHPLLVLLPPPTSLARLENGLWVGRGDITSTAGDSRAYRRQI